MTTPVSLERKSAVVTGAASGLGRGIAELLAANGASVVVMDRDDASETVAGLAGRDGQQHHGVRVDVSDPDAVAGAFAEVDDLGVAVDVLVNCAGIREIDTALDLDPAMWQRVIGVNLSGPFYCSQQVGRRMAARGRGGVIVNVTSVAGLVAMTHRPAYSSSKHGLIGLTKNLARDLSPHNVRVNAVAPGTVRTPLTEAYYHDEEFLAGVEGMVPLGFEGTPTDVANAVLFFASDLSSWVTGTVLPVDGGWLAERNYAPHGAKAYNSKSSGSAE